MQHLELSRIVARKFNNKFGKVFPEPKNYMLKPLRIMSLKHPDKKMSKTNDEPIYLDDSHAEITAKLKKAVTASGGEGSKGVENLMYLLEQFSTADMVAEFRGMIKDESIRYSDLKQVLADEIAEYFSEFRERKKELLGDKQKLASILADGAERAREVARETLTEVKEKIGLL